MKKFIVALLLCVASASFCFGQSDYSGIEGFDDFYSSNGDKIGLRVGAYGGFQPVLGGLADYVSVSLGGGISGEYDIITFSDINITAGASAHVGGNVGLLKTDLVSSLFNMQVLAGAYVRVPILDTGFYVQPEIDYGITANFPKVNPEYAGNTLKNCYLDQTIQLALGVRYNPSFADGMLEFEVTPVYTLCTEKGNMLHYVGARVGVMMSL